MSNGRSLFGVGGGWNAEEMADHGTVFATRFKLLHERIAAMKAIWTEDTAEYRGDLVAIAPLRAWPKPVQQPHPPVLVGGLFPYARRRALGRRLGPASEPLAIRRRHRVSATVPRHGGGRGAARVVSLPSAGADEILPVLDDWAELIRHVPPNSPAPVNLQQPPDPDRATHRGQRSQGRANRPDT